MALRKINEQPPASPESSQRTEYLSDGFGKKIIVILVGVLLVYLTLYVGTLMRNNVKKYHFIGQSDQMERTITINGTGKVNGVNDIAVTTIGYTVVNKDVSVAQAENKKVMDAVFAELKKLGIEDKDLQSNYTIYPEYTYTQDRGQELRGYRVTNNVTVKIRDLEKITSVLSLPAQFGANEVSGLSFTIDDVEALRSQAREKALVDAKEKAYELARSLGVSLGEVVSYNEYANGGEPPYYPVYGRGGMMDMQKEAAPAQIASGSQDVSMEVSITYTIFPKYR